MLGVAFCQDIPDPEPFNTLNQLKETFLLYPISRHQPFQALNVYYNSSQQILSSEIFIALVVILCKVSGIITSSRIHFNQTTVEYRPYREK